MSVMTNQPDIHDLARTGASRSARRRQAINSFFYIFCLTVTSIAVIVLTVLLVTVAVQGWDGLSWEFINRFGSRKPESAGIKAALWGSVWICAVCGLVALPVGVGTAIYLEEYAQKNRITSFIRTNISNLAGVPSIVYGIIGLTIFARMFGLPGVGTETSPSVTFGSSWYDTYYAADGNRLQLLIDGKNAEPRPIASGDPLLLVEESDASLVDPATVPVRVMPRDFEGGFAAVDPTQTTIQLLEDSEESTSLGAMTQVRALNPKVWKNMMLYQTSATLNADNLQRAPSSTGEWLVAENVDGEILVVRAQGDQTQIQDGDKAFVLRTIIPMVSEREATRSHREEAIDVQMGEGGQLIKDKKWLEYRVLDRQPTRYVLREAPTNNAELKLTDWTPVYLKYANTFVETGSKTVVAQVVPDGTDITQAGQIHARDASSPSSGERTERRAWYYLQFPFGKGVLAGGLTLMLVILPVVIIASVEALRAVPNSLRQASLALGGTKWQTIRQVALPASIPMIMTGSILAMSRAIGEAAPILVLGVALFITRTPENLMDQFTILPMQVYNWAGRPQDSFQQLAASGIIILLIVLLTFNAAAILIRQKLQKPLQ